MTIRKKLRLFAAIAIVSMLTPSFSCPSGEKGLFLYCGAGLRPPVGEIVEIFSQEYNVKVDCSYGGAGTLLNQIQLTKRGDLFMPGDVSYIDHAGELIICKHRVCYLIPVILVKKGNPKNIKGIDDLVAPGIRLGLGNPKAVPVGRKAIEIFEKANIKIKKVEKNLVFSAMTVNELGVQIKVGKIDAAIVWDGVAAYFSDSADIIEIPKERNAISTVAIALLSCSMHKLAQNFIDFISSEQGQEIFHKHHFSIRMQK